MSHRIAYVLDRLAQLWLLAAVLIFVTGGLNIEIGGVRFKGQGIANPIAMTIITAGLRRLIAPDSDPVSRILSAIRARIGSEHGRRLFGWLRRHADAAVFVLLALFIFDRGTAGIIAVEGDGVGYYAYLRSVLIDHDLDFLNEYRDFDARQQWFTHLNSNGRVENPFAIGPAILWAPFFMFGWAAAATARLSGADVAVHGYSTPFTWACAGGTWLFGLLAVVLVYRLVLCHFDRRTALIAAVGTTMASPMAYYSTYANFYSHAHSFLVATLFFLLCTITPSTASLRRWLGLGLTGGLVAITRWQDAVFWIIPAVHLAHVTWASYGRGKVWPAVRNALSRGSIFLVGVGIGVAPQLLVFKLLNGYWLGIPQGDSFVEPFPRWLGETLFSTYRGLFTWSPILLLGTIGLLVACYGRRPWAGAFLLAFVVQLVANASVSQWWAGHAFGARRFSSCVALFAFGLGELLHRARVRPRVFNGLVALIAVAVLWNHLLLHQWLAAEMPHGTPADVDTILSHAWDDITGLEVREVLGEETFMALVVARLADLVGPRMPLLLMSVAFLLLTRQRALSQIANTDGIAGTSPS